MPLIELVVADESHVAAVGAAQAPSQTWPGIDAKGIDHVKLGKLLSIVVGQPYQNSLVAEFTQLHEQSQDGPWVFRVPMRLVRGLAQLDDNHRAHVAGEWWKIEEFALDRWDPSAVKAILNDICSLAKKAVSDKKSMLMWMCL